MLDFSFFPRLAYPVPTAVSRKTTRNRTLTIPAEKKR